jgi:hypothetical protein
MAKVTESRSNGSPDLEGVIGIAAARMPVAFLYLPLGAMRGYYLPQEISP